jgi:molybdenum cofactor biosynthesis protein B
MPEAVKVLFDKSIDGFGEMFRLIFERWDRHTTVQSSRKYGQWHGYFAYLAHQCAVPVGILKDQFDSRTRPCTLYRILRHKTQVTTDIANDYHLKS